MIFRISMLDELANQLSLAVDTGKIYIYPWLVTFAILWAINIFNWLMGSIFNTLGILPRHLFGLVGILFSPIFHHDFSHLFFNSIPLFALGFSLLIRGLDIFWNVTVTVWLLGGLGVWVCGRKGLHIGASGVISGYFGYILVTAYTNPSITTFLLALLSVYYFGSIFLGLFPQEEKISWEAHLMGFLSGIASAYIPLFIPNPFH